MTKKAKNRKLCFSKKKKKIMYVDMQTSRVNSIKCTGFFNCNMLTTLHKIKKKYNQNSRKKKKKFEFVKVQDFFLFMLCGVDVCVVASLYRPLL